MIFFMVAPPTRSDGVLWIISSEYGLEHLMDDVVDFTGVDMHEAT